EYTMAENTTAVPLTLAGYESAFIIFRKDAGNQTATGQVNFPEAVKTNTLNKPWTVNFDRASRGPAAPVVFTQLTDWSQHADTSIAHYSGAAVYHTTFTAEQLTEGQRAVLDLGSATAIARVKVNGKEVGGVWTPPYQLDISAALQPGENTLEVKVVNTWANR